MKLNRPLVTFLLFIGVFFVVIKNIIESKYLSEYVSGEITKMVSKKIDAKIKFDSLTIGLWPLGTTLNGVSLSMGDAEDKKQNTLIKIELEDIVLRFSIFDLFTNDLVLDGLKLHGGEIEITSYVKESPSDNLNRFDIKKINLTKLFEDYYLAILKELPFEIREISFHEMTVVHNDFEIQVEQLEIDLDKEYLKVYGNVEKFNHVGLKDIVSDFDSLEINIQLTREEFNIFNFKLYQNLDMASFQGNIIQKEHGPRIDGELKYRGSLEKLEWIDDRLKGQSKGFVILESRLHGEITNPIGHVKTELFGIKTPYVLADYMQLEFEKKEGDIELTKFLYRKGEGEISLREKASLFNTESWQFLLNPLKLELKNAYSNDFLYALNDDLNIVKTNVSGKVDLKFVNNNDLYITSVDKLILHNLELRKDENIDSILENKKIEVSNAEIVVLNSGGLKIGTTLNIGERTQLNAMGTIGNDGVNFYFTKDSFDFLEIGKIAGVEIRGNGELAGRIFGKNDDIRFEFNGNLKDIGVLNFSLGDGDIHLIYNLKKSHLEIINLKTNFRNSKLELIGLLDLSDKQQESVVDANIVDMNFKHLFDMAPTIFKEIEFLKNDLFMNLAGKIKMTGGLKDTKIKLKGEVIGNNIIFHQEDWNDIRFNLDMEKGVIRFEDIILTKSLGTARGRFLANTINNFLEYDITLKNLRFKDFNFYNLLGLSFDSELSGDFYGSGIGEQFQTNSNLYLKKSRVESMSYNDSSIKVRGMGKDLEITSHFLGETIFLTFQNLAHGYSQLLLEVNDFQSRDIFNFLSEHNLVNQGIGGEIDFKMTSVFNIKDFSTLDLILDIKKLSLIKDNKYLKMERPTSLVVAKGALRAWELKLLGSLGSFESKGRGVIRKDYSVESKIVLDTELLTLLSNKIQRTHGEIRGDIFLKGDKKKSDIAMMINGERLSGRFDDPIGNITDGKIDVLLENDTLSINNFEARYGKGKISLGGNIIFQIPYSQLNLEYSIDKAIVPILKKSQVMVSGNGTIRGDAIPYQLNGNLIANQSEIIEELSDFGQDAGHDSSYGRFLPKENVHLGPSLFDLNIDVVLERPMSVKNNLAELFFDGDIALRGEFRDPLFTGRLNANPANSKFVFRGNEFKIAQGEILFRDEGRKQSPMLTFVGNSTINNYNVKLELRGAADNLAINLTSEPQLSQSDLFSLLAFGMTNDLSKDLDESQRRAVTTVGIGSLIADQLKIGQGLKSSLGINLSVLPEFGEDETTLLHGKSAVSDSSGGRVKSSTKVKVQKKLMDKVDMAVSSTVGGSLEQKQEMNINYNFNNNISVEGVYEIRSSNEEQAAEAPSSFGLDFKFRRTFR